MGEAGPARTGRADAVGARPLDQATDERLALLAREGSEHAFAEIVRRYQRPLHSYSARLIGADWAADAVQHTFLQTFVALRDGRGEIALRPWLYRVCRNCAIDMLRKHAPEHDQIDPNVDGVPQPPQIVEEREEMAGVFDGLRALPAGQREALIQSAFEGRSHEEIADRMGRSSGGIRQLIFRAREALR